MVGLKLIHDFKVKRYISNITRHINSDDFLHLFSSCSVLGYTQTTLDEEDYKTMQNVLNKMLEDIDKQPEFRQYLCVEDGYLIPNGSEWVRLTVNNDKPIGLTMYLEDTYKLFTFENRKLVTFSKTPKSNARGIRFIKENLTLI